MGPKGEHSHQEHRDRRSLPVEPRVIDGEGTVEGAIQFEVTLTDPDYSVEEVAEKLRSGEIYMCFGDEQLYDENRAAVIGSVEWFGVADFVPFEVNAVSEDCESETTEP